MALARSNNGLDGVLAFSRNFIRQKRVQLQNALETRRIYYATLRELSMLSDRDLNDLGISRSGIKNLALEAAYGD